VRAGLIRLLFFAVLTAECFAQSNTPTTNLGSALSQGLADAMRESRAQEAAATNQQKNTGPLLSQVTITGKVIPAEWSAKEAATVSIRGLCYKIFKDAKGKVVAKDAAGKKVEIKGTVTERDGTTWITVTWCALVE